MKIKFTAMGLVLTGMLATTPAIRADDAAIEKELKVLEGEWTVKSQGGDDVSYKFKGNKLEVTALAARTR